MPGNTNVSSGIVRRRRKSLCSDTASYKASGIKVDEKFCESAFCKRVLENSAARFCSNDFCQMRRGLLLASAQNNHAMSFLKKPMITEKKNKILALDAATLISNPSKPLIVNGAVLRRASSMVLKHSKRFNNDEDSSGKHTFKRNKAKRKVRSSQSEVARTLTSAISRSSTIMDTTTRFSEKRIRKKSSMEARELGEFLIPLGKKQGGAKSVGGGRYIRNGNRLSDSSSVPTNPNSSERRVRKSMAASRNPLSSPNQLNVAVEKNLTTQKALRSKQSLSSIERIVSAQDESQNIKQDFIANDLESRKRSPSKGTSIGKETLQEEKEKPAQKLLVKDETSLISVHYPKLASGGATQGDMIANNSNVQTHLPDGRLKSSPTKPVRTITAGEYLHGRCRLGGLVCSDQNEGNSWSHDEIRIKEKVQRGLVDGVTSKLYQREEMDTVPGAMSCAPGLTTSGQSSKVACETPSTTSSIESTMKKEITRENDNMSAEQTSRDDKFSSDCRDARANSTIGSNQPLETRFDTRTFVPDVLKLPSFVYSCRHRFIYSLLVVFTDILSPRIAAVHNVTKKPRKLKFYLEYIRRVESIFKQFDLKVSLDKNQALVTIKERKWLCFQGVNTMTLYKQVLEKLLSQSEMWQAIIDEADLIMRSVRQNGHYQTHLALVFQQLWRKLPALQSVVGDRHVWYFHGKLHHWVFTIDNVEIGSGSHEDQQAAYSEACADSISFLLDVSVLRTHGISSRDLHFNPTKNFIRREKKRQRTFDTRCQMNRPLNALRNTPTNAQKATDNAGNESQAERFVDSTLLAAQDKSETSTREASQSDQPIPCISCEMLRLRKPDHPHLKCHRCQSGKSSCSQLNPHPAFPPNAPNVPCVSGSVEK